MQIKRTADAVIISKWRNANYRCFTSQKKSTPESTAKWIENCKGILYGVYVGDNAADERIVGHFTLSKDNELGAVLKDPKYRQPVMKDAILSVIKNKKTWLIVLADNKKAIEFYKKLGFKKTGIEKHNDLLHFRMER